MTVKKEWQSREEAYWDAERFEPFTENELAEIRQLQTDLLKQVDIVNALAKSNERNAWHLLNAVLELLESYERLDPWQAQHILLDVAIWLNETRRRIDKRILDEAQRPRPRGQLGGVP